MNVPHKMYALTYFVWTIISLQYKNSIKMAIFAKSEKDVWLGFRTRASKSVVKKKSLCANRPSGKKARIKLYLFMKRTRGTTESSFMFLLRSRATVSLFHKFDVTDSRE